MSVQEKIQRIRARLPGHTTRGQEREILDTLASATAEELSAVLLGLDLPRLLAAMDDRAYGPDNHAALLDLLARQRLPDLSVPARAALIGALQRGSTPRAQEIAVRDVFLGTPGAALTSLKAAIEEGEDHRDLHQLLYLDIDDEEIRAEILAHIESQAASESRSLKILSDIDDTIYANWVDARYPKKTLYPGVRAFYSELDRGLDGGWRGDLVFVTARPGDSAGLIEGSTRAMLRGQGFPRATVLTGGFANLHSSAAIAARKFRNFEEYARIYPEYDFVFIGDNGQGDADFGAEMLRALPHRVRGVLIHHVIPPRDEGARAEQEAAGVEFFHTYAGAAARAHKRDLLDAAGLARVRAAVEADLAAVAFAAEEHRAAVRALLEAELA